MTVYGGFDPGTFQPWALNIAQTSMGSWGVARGLAVSAQSPASMNVNVGVDATAGDGICWLPNGCWLRIDAALTLAVPNNTSGSTRTDAVVAFVDPTGVGGSPAVQYVTGWTSGFRTTPASNQLVLALVTVPNGAASIVAANIAVTAYQASIGSASPVQLDSVVQDNGPGAQQPRVFSQYNVVVAPSATSNQTSFAVPLTARQKLVAMGRIGGGDELGYFAGPAGWYVPRLFGSTSGPLAVKSVDYVGGNIITASGAVSGEQVVASFKYYDFDRDLAIWAGSVLLPRNSPYLVYQGDLHAGTQHLMDDLWDGTLNGVMPATAGMSIVVTCFGRFLQPHFAATAAGQQFSVAVDGAAPSTTTLPFAPNVGPVGGGQLYNLNTGAAIDGIHQVALAYVTGLFEFAGCDVMCHQGGVYLAGGQAVVDGFPVTAGNTSVTLFPPAQGQAAVLYIDRFGNTTASARSQIFPVGENLGLRIPLGQAFGPYARATGTSTLYGIYAGVGTPKGLPALVSLGGRNGGNSILGSGAVANAWALAADPASPVGAVWTTNATQDYLAVGAPMTGCDVVMSLAQTAQFAWQVASGGVVTSGATIVAPSPAPARVRLTVASSLPLGQYTVGLYMATTYGSNAAGWAAEFAELRYPELPTPPPQTLPLAGILAGGGQTLGTFGTFSLVKDVLHDAQFNGDAAGAGTFQLLNDFAHGQPGPMVRLANTSTNQSWAQVVHCSGAFRVRYEGTPSTGIFNVVVDGVSTYGTVDTFAGVGVFNPSAVSPTYYLPTNQPHTIACVATGTKNTSSTALPVVIQGIEYAPPPHLVLDAVRYGVDGLRPSIRGSAVLSQKGEALADAGTGIGTLHLQDRAVTSRKLAPSWNRQVGTAAFSGAPGIYPGLAAGVLVETPSLLLCLGQMTPRQGGGVGAGWMTLQFVVDGVQQAGTTGASATYDDVNAQKMVPLMANDIFVVGPGAHTVQLWLGGGSPFPYLDNGQATLSVVAFAL